MPIFDGTGPMGNGRMTGGGRGFCGMGKGAGGRAFVRVGFGRGGGRGHRHCFYATGLTGWQRAQRGIREEKQEEGK